MSEGLPEYTKELFVDREAEIKMVEDAVQALLKGEQPESRVIVFTGGRGLGKTWLLRHLLRKELPQRYSKQITPLFTDLTAYETDKPTLAITALLLDLCQNQLGGEVKGGTPFALATDLTNTLQFKPPAVLLIDSVYEADWKFLPILEDYLLAPLFTHGKGLIVMTGRGKAYPWASASLRLEANRKELQPFAAEDTAAQLEDLVESDRIESIQEWSLGIPLANHRLAAAGSAEAGLQVVMDELFTIVSGGAERQRIREAVEALSVFNYFDEERIQLAFRTCFPQNGSKWLSYREATDFQKGLVALRMARWDGEQGGYVLDSSLRHFAHEFLRQEYPVKYCVLHRAALELYHGWSKEFPATGAIWQQEMEHHRQQLENCEGVSI